MRFRLVRAERLSEAFRERLLSWEHSGFSVDAGATIEATQRESLERMARYVTRTPVAMGKVFDHGENVRVPEQVARDAFGDGLDTEDEFGWRLKYGDDGRSDVYLPTDEAGLVTGLSVNRPCRGR